MDTYPIKGVCPNQLQIEVNGGTVGKVKFTGGCSGNSQGLAALINGMSVKEAIARLKGIKCGGRPTSCPDQLAKVLENYI